MPAKGSLLTKALTANLHAPFPPGKATSSRPTVEHGSEEVSQPKAAIPSLLSKGMPVGKPLVRKRVRIPDIDKAIDETATVVAQAKKQLKAAAVQRRNAQRRRSRLVAKAAKLPADDLYKIAVYKRTNILAHILENNKDTLKESLKNLVDQSDGASLQTLMKHLADVAGGPAQQTTGQCGSSGADAVVEPAQAIVPAPAPAALPVVNPLGAPEQLADGSEQYRDGVAVAADGESVIVEQNGAEDDNHEIDDE